MSHFKAITSFKNITFDENKKPLVICDIDLTVIKPEKDIDHYRKSVKSDFGNNEECEDLAKSMYHLALGVGLIKATDIEGFYWLIQQTEKLGGKFIFLTARGPLSHDKTLCDLKKAGIINPEKYKIHYTDSKISKGEYIRKYKLTEDFEHISFIDDYPHYLSSVYGIYPNINCYLFKCD